jgi:predicted Zn-dependent peptidase
VRRALLPLVIALLTVSLAETQRGDLIVLREASSPFVAFNIWVKSGSAADPKGKEGLAALTGSLIAAGGTAQDSYESILAKQYPLAAGYSVTVDKEMTTITGRVHRDNLDAYYALFKNALLSPAFADADFTRAKAQRLNYPRTRPPLLARRGVEQAAAVLDRLRGHAVRASRRGLRRLRALHHG